MTVETVRLGDVTDFVSGYAFASERFGETGGLPLARIRDVDRGQSETYYTGPFEEKFVIGNGDLLIAMDGDFRVGYWRGGRALLNQRVCRAIPEESDLDLHYLGYALPRELQRIQDRTSFVTVKHLSVKQLRALRIPLPPLPEQRRIAAILYKADAVRRKLQQTLDLADQFLRSAFLDLFGDPVTNPKGWPVKKLGDLCRVVRGSSPRPKGDPRYYDGPVPRLMVADITRDGWLVTPKIDSLTEAGARLSRPVPAGTVVMVVSGNVGVVAQLETDACIHDGFVGFLDLDEPAIDPEYFLLALHFLKSTHERRKAGAIWQNLTTHDIKRIPVLMPPRELQEQSRQIMSGFRALGDGLDSALRAVDSLARSLTQRAFRGEL